MISDVRSSADNRQLLDTCDNNLKCVWAGDSASAPYEQLMVCDGAEAEHHSSTDRHQARFLNLPPGAKPWRQAIGHSKN